MTDDVCEWCGHPVPASCDGEGYVDMDPYIAEVRGEDIEVMGCSTWFADRNGDV